MTCIDAKIYVRAEIDGDQPFFDIHVVRGGHDFICEDIDTHLYLDPQLLLSKRQLAMPTGTVVRLMASITMVYTQDYWGEHDSDLEVNRLDVLKVSAPSRKQTKKDAFRLRKTAAKPTKVT